MQVRKGSTLPLTRMRQTRLGGLIKLQYQAKDEEVKQISVHRDQSTEYLVSLVGDSLGLGLLCSAHPGLPPDKT